MLSRTHTVLERVISADVPDRRDVAFLLRLEDDRQVRLLFDFADQVRRRYVGDGVLLRGIIEFSNFCRNTCAYCGLRRPNRRLKRYRLTAAEILETVENIRRLGVKTVVLQSGEEDNLDAEWLGRIIEDVKRRFDVAVTLSVGERARDEYAMWKDAGADRYLLKIETSDPALYEDLHPGMSFENRIRCLEDLADLGYQTGSGNLVGLRGQTVENLVGDILFFKKGDFDMISVSPFIPHADTPLATVPAGDLRTTLKMIALTRIVSRDAHIPASTAIGSLNGQDARDQALAVGANVVMPNFTPMSVRPLYEIYPGKIGAETRPDQSIVQVERMVTAMGRFVDRDTGHSLKRRRTVGPTMTQSNYDFAQ
ncbi:MAG TPA: [FeFe] hydrogenase H-cluster radical SAM maturase HydE [Sedimentisphaerales bacterium]|nr:[FeFe] hydrogenase H-cluster radical SAM maturase HydE [Sedimentisphaerales bacterium]HRV46775.1 [FeFe] hydrogenase H-cluster radical SAM maturase HydE [Sedimentisphaerales bacterium]